MKLRKRGICGFGGKVFAFGIIKRSQNDQNKKRKRIMKKRIHDGRKKKSVSTEFIDFITFTRF